MDAGTSEGSDSAEPTPRKHIPHTHATPTTSHVASGGKVSAGSPTQSSLSKSNLLKPSKDQSHITFSPSTKSLVSLLSTYSLTHSLTHSLWKGTVESVPASKFAVADDDFLKDESWRNALSDHSDNDDVSGKPTIPDYIARRAAQLQGMHLTSASITLDTPLPDAIGSDDDDETDVPPVRPASAMGSRVPKVRQSCCLLFLF